MNKETSPIMSGRGKYRNHSASTMQQHQVTLHSKSPSSSSSIRISIRGFAHIFKPHHYHHRLKAKAFYIVFVLILLQPLPISSKGLVGKLPGNPASCPEEPCNSDPQHVLYALKWMSVIFGFILLIPLLGYYLSKCYTKLLSYSKSKSKSSPSSSKESSVSSKSSTSNGNQKRAKNGATKKRTDAPKGKQKHDNKQQGSDSAESAADSADMALLEANQLVSDMRRKSSLPGIQNNTSFVNQQKDTMSNRKLSSALATQFNQADNAKLGQLNSEMSHRRNIELAQLMAGSNDVTEQQQQQQQQRFGVDNAQLEHRYSIVIPQHQQQQQPEVKSYSRSLKGRPSSGRRLMKIYPAELQQLGAAPDGAEGDLALDANNDYDQQHFRQQYSNQQSLLANRRPSSGHRESPDGHYMELEQQKHRQETLAQISLVSQLCQQQQTANNNNTLALPNNYNQHRHSIDGSILNNMVHHMQHSHDQANSLTPSDLVQVRQFNSGGRLAGPETQVTQMIRGRSPSKHLDQAEVHNGKSGYHRNEQLLFADEPNHHRDRRPSLNAAVMRHNL